MSAKEIDDYLASVPEPKRASLESLRRSILAVIPEAEQCISYGMPAFRVDGKVLAGFAAFKNHLAYLPHSGRVFQEIPELDGYTKTTGTRGVQVFGDLNDVIPEMSEKWSLPAHFERTLPSQSRSANWRETEVIEDLAEYLGAEMARVNARIEELRLTVTASDIQKSEKELELIALIQQLEALGSAKIGADHE